MAMTMVMHMLTVKGQGIQILYHLQYNNFWHLDIHRCSYHELYYTSLSWPECYLTGPVMSFSMHGGEKWLHLHSDCCVRQLVPDSLQPWPDAARYILAHELHIRVRQRTIKHSGYAKISSGYIFRAFRTTACLQVANRRPVSACDVIEWRAEWAACQGVSLQVLGPPTHEQTCQR